MRGNIIMAYKVASNEDNESFLSDYRERVTSQIVKSHSRDLKMKNLFFCFSRKRLSFQFAKVLLSYEKYK